MVFVAFAALGFSWFAGFRRDRGTSTGSGSRSGARTRTFSSPILRCSRWRPGPAVAVALTRLHDRRVWMLVGAIVVVGRAGGCKRHVEGRGRTHLAAVRSVGVGGDDGALGRSPVASYATVVGPAGRLHARGRGDDMVAVVIPARARPGCRGRCDGPRGRGALSRARRHRRCRGRRRRERIASHAGMRWPDLVVLDLMLPRSRRFRGVPPAACYRTGSRDHADRPRRRRRPRYGSRARCRRLRRQALLARASSRRG